MCEKASTTLRNSPLRVTFSPVIEKTADLLAEKVHPDTLTIAGFLGRTAVCIWSAAENSHTDRKPRYPALRAGLSAVFTLFDALDGSVARKRQELGLPVSPYGCQLDGLSDRTLNIIVYLCHANSAHNRHDLAAEIAGLSGAATSGLPSLAKQLAAKEGVAVPEFGTGFALLGNHVVRSISGITGDILPQLTGILDSALTLGNLDSTRQRLKAAASEIPGLNGPEKQNARKMTTLYSATAILGVLATGAYLLAQRQPSRPEC